MLRRKRGSGANRTQRNGTKQENQNNEVVCETASRCLKRHALAFVLFTGQLKIERTDMRAGGTKQHGMVYAAASVGEWARVVIACRVSLGAVHKLFQIQSFIKVGQLSL